MKSILLSILFLFLPKLAISQISENDRIIYLDSTEAEIHNDNYKYYRIIKDAKLKKETYIVQDYYKSGVLKMKGMSSNGDYLRKEGQFVFYYENGNKKSTANYIKNFTNGKEFKWYENGNKKEDGEYILTDEKRKEYEYKVNQFWNSDGVQKVIDGNGDYEEINKHFYGSGKVKDGFKDGIWQGWTRSSDNKYTEKYENGKLVSGTIIDKNNIETKYNVLIKKPEPKNGISDFLNYVSRNYRIPTNAPKGITGKVYATFIVDIDGKIVDIKILRDIGYGTGEEAIRVLSSYNKFIAAEDRGQKVRCSYSIPIAIKGPN